jgi:hypothetical protein
MENKFGHIATYLLVFVLILLGALFFFFRDEIFFTIEDKFIEEPIAREIKVDVDELIDPEIIRDERLTEMEKTVPYFNFNRLGRTRPAGMEQSQLPIFKPVYLGNNQPFK